MLMSAPLAPLTHAMAARAAEHIVNLRLKHQVLSGLPEAWRPRTMTEGYLIQSFAHRYLIAAGFGSIAGFTALSRKTANIKDAYDAAELTRLHPSLRFDAQIRLIAESGFLLSGGFQF